MMSLLWGKFNREECALNLPEVYHDLGLEVLVENTSETDSYIREAFKSFLLTPATSCDLIKYRQDVLQDAIRNEGVVRELYSVITYVLENRRKRYLAVFGKYPSSLVYSSYKLLRYLIEAFKDFLEIVIKERSNFSSQGFKEVFSWVEEVYKGKERIERFLDMIDLDHGYAFEISLGEGGIFSKIKPVVYDENGFLSRFFKSKRSFRLYAGDESSDRVLFEIKERGLYDLSIILSKISKAFLMHLENLRKELAFLVGTLNLRKKLIEIGMPISFPTCGEKIHFVSLYDPSLALIKHKSVVSNSASIEKRLVVISGANKGGKTTFLRSIGLAQLMYQVGLFAPAKMSELPIFDGIFTHFKKEEDQDLKRGRLEEELRRMKEIVSMIKVKSLKKPMVLMNESFSSTSEFEGSAIAEQITSGLSDLNSMVFYVTHFRSFKSLVCNGEAECYRAEILSSGKRTYKIVKGESLAEYHGKDIFDKVFNGL